MSKSERKGREQAINLLFILAKAYLERGEYAEAIEKYKKLIQLGVKDATVYRNLSKAYIMSHRFDDEAREVYEKALSYDPNDRTLGTILSQIYLGAGRDDPKALEIYELVQKDQPQNIKEFSWSLARIFYKRGEFQKAREHAKKAIQSDGDDVELWSFFVSTCWQSAAYDEAIQLLKKSPLVHRDFNSLKLLILTYLKKKAACLAEGKKFILDKDDSIHCYKFLKSLPVFRRLKEISFYLDVKQLLREARFEFKKEESLKPIEEYEIILSEKSVDYFWEQNNHSLTESDFDFDFTEEVLNQLKPLEPLAKGKAESLLTEEELKSIKMPLWNVRSSYDTKKKNTFEALFALRISNFDDLISQNGESYGKSICQKFLLLAASQLRKQAHKSVRSVEDGLLVFSNNLRDTVLAALEIIKKLERYNSAVVENERIEVQIVIHRTKYRYIQDQDQTLEDLAVLLKLHELDKVGQVEGDEIERLRTEIFPFVNRIVITENVYQNIITFEDVYALYAGTFRMKNIPETCRIYELRGESFSPRVAFHRKVGRFEIIEPLSSGEVYVIYKAKDALLGRPVILRVLRSDLALTPQQQSYARELFLKEARIIGRLSHPNIGVTYDVGDYDGLAYMAREYLEGTDLTQILEQQESIDAKRLAKIIIQVGHALEYAHESGIIHCNVKPSNIIVSEDDETKITDFAILSLLKLSDNSQQPEDLARLSYLSPEQITETPVDNRSDIFSLGVIVYESLTGRKPFPMSEYPVLKKHIFFKPPLPPTSFNPDLPPLYDRIIAKALAQEPWDRYQQVADMVVDLQTILDAEMPE